MILHYRESHRGINGAGALASHCAPSKSRFNQLILNLTKRKVKIKIFMVLTRGGGTNRAIEDWILDLDLRNWSMASPISLRSTRTLGYRFHISQYQYTPIRWKVYTRRSLRSLATLMPHEYTDTYASTSYYNSASQWSKSLHSEFIYIYTRAKGKPHWLYFYSEKI